MRNLKIWQKLLLLGAVLMVPFAIVTSRMVLSIHALGVDFAEQEARGLEHYRPLLSLLMHLQQHRGMTNAWLNGDPSFKDKASAKGAQIEADLAKVDELDLRYGAEFHTHDKWTHVRATCKDILTRASSLSAEQSSSLHTDAVAATIVV